MLKKEDVVLHFKAKISPEYREDLDSLFYFNRNQTRYVERINQSIDEYSKPIVVEENGEVALVFQDRSVGQTLHIFDGEHKGASLIGAVMYSRDSKNRITIVHLALHENCKTIYKKEGVNIASLVLDEVLKILTKIKGIEKVRIYYINKEFSVGKLMNSGAYV
jgi:hypothetical protein